MKVEIWSDVVCPWCYIAKRRFESALSHFAHAEEVAVEWRSFELDPNAPGGDDTESAVLLARKYGFSVGEARLRQARVTEIAAAEGLDYHLEATRRSNTFDAHRLLHLAKQAGLQGALKERLMHAFFTDGERVSDHDVLERLALEVGLEAGAVTTLLGGAFLAEEVRADERRARELGATGVPYFLVDDRYGVSGAQDPHRFSQLLDSAWLDARSAAK